MTSPADVVQVQTPSREELVARAAALVPLLKENAERIDRDRRIPDEIIAALDDAGFFRLSMPKRYGGYESDIRTQVAVTRELGRGDGSTAWVVGLASSCSWLAGRYGAQAQDDVWGSGVPAIICGHADAVGTAIPVDGGYRFSGSWGFSTASSHAQWTTITAKTTDPSGKPAIVQALVPRTELITKDTWYVTGMRGTGSNTTVADDVFVPTHRTILVTDPDDDLMRTPFTDEPLFRAAIVPIGCMYLVGSVLGMANAALELVSEKARTKGIHGTLYKTQMDAPIAQAAIARAAVTIKSAELMIESAGADIMRYAISGEPMPEVLRAELRCEISWSAREARRAVDGLVSLHGASTFAVSNPLERIYRDILTGSRHAFFNAEIAEEIYGGVRLGTEHRVTTFI
ncbi:acyl-CoA dehydrogenase family protein [Microbacterium sp. X-17]|uniref:acyl-CoA dehydrogenase family protein n=1 Tax=Microbacterium sp. X-17 TaxID=3144404 RepID=UPI0031F507B6